MFANEDMYELLDNEDPFEFYSIWVGFPVTKVKHKSYEDADIFDLMLAAGAFKEDYNAEEKY